jgi:hypothetical protein
MMGQRRAAPAMCRLACTSITFTPLRQQAHCNTNAFSYTASDINAETVLS